MSIVSRGRGTLIILRTLPGQRRVPYLPREQIVAIRDARVQETVRYAAEHVPFYRDLFRSEGIDPAELQTADDLARLPLLTKELVFDAPERFRSDEFVASEVLRLKTSGRSGVPLEIWHDRRSLLRGVAYAERDRAVEAHLAGRRFGYRVLEIRASGFSGERIQTVLGEASFRPLRPKVRQIPVESPVERVLAELAARKPHVLRTYGSYAETFFRAAVADGLEPTLPKVLVYSGDGVSEAGRRFVEERFGIPVISRYAAIEAPRIGFTCEHRTGFHLHEDLCHVRLVGPSGEDTRPGDTGQIVVSALEPQATVFLNYRLGDHGRFVDELCPCGRTLRRLAALDGHVGEVIRLGPGLLSHRYAIWLAVFDLEEVVSFQLVQLEPRRFELRLVATNAEAYERVRPVAAERVAALLHGATVEAKRFERLELDRRNGKVERIVLLPQRDDA